MTTHSRRVAASPDWLAHRYQPNGDAVHFVHAPRALQGAMTFLADEYLPQSTPREVVPRSRAVSEASAPAPLHFVFHSGFCCSTTLARALDLPGRATALKEPVLLQDLTGYLTQPDFGGDRQAVTTDLLRLLARPFAGDPAVVAKPSCSVNAIAERLLDMRPDSRAVLMYAPLPVFLGSIVRKGLTGRLWARELFAVLRRMGCADLGFSAEDTFGQTDLQIAASAWLVQQRIFARLVGRFGPGRVATLESERFLADRSGAIEGIGTLFGLGLDASEVAAIVAGPAFSEHSKTGTGFDTSDRARERAEGERAHRDEIDKVAFWAGRVAEAQGIAMSPGAQLA